MRSMSRDYAKKLLQIRKSEGITQKKFSEITGISLGTIQKYETGHQQARSEIMEKILQVEIFEKYTMWLLHDVVTPQTGQIAPELSHIGSDGSEATKRTGKMVMGSDVKSSRSVRKAG